MGRQGVSASVPAVSAAIGPVRTALVLLYLGLCLLVSGVEAQMAELGSCEVWKGRPAVCEPYIRYHFDTHSTRHVAFVPTGVSQAQLALAVESALPPLLRVAPAECRKAAVQLACLSAFLPCADARLSLGNVTSPLPRFVCKAVCKGVNGWCGSLPGVPPVDCDQLEPNTGLPFYPDQATRIPTPAGSELVLPCFADASFPTRVPEANCPTLFKYDDELDTCRLLCPDGYLQYTHHQRVIFRVFKLASSALAVGIIAFSMVPWVLKGSKRRFPGSVTVLLMLYVLLLNAAFMASGVPDPDTYYCEDEFALLEFTAFCNLYITWSWVACGGGLLMCLLCITINSCMTVFFRGLPNDHVVLQAVEYFLIFVPYHTFWLVLVVKDKTAPILYYQACAFDDPDVLLAWNIVSTVSEAVVTLLLLVCLAAIIRRKFELASGVNAASTAAVLRETGIMLFFVFMQLLIVAYTLVYLWILYDTIPDQEQWLMDRALCYAAGDKHCGDETPIIPWEMQIVQQAAGSLLSALVIFIVLSCRGWAVTVYKDLLRGSLPPDSRLLSISTFGSNLGSNPG